METPHLVIEDEFTSKERSVGKPTLKVASFRVESICALLQVAPSTNHAAKYRASSARAVSDAMLTPELETIREANSRVYGARKLWKAARRAGIDIGRDQTARLVRASGIEGATRTKRVKTTRADPAASRHPDLVHREFSEPDPNRLLGRRFDLRANLGRQSRMSVSSSMCSRG